MLTAEEGEKLAADYMASLKKCFAANDFTSQHAMMADHAAWDWRGGIKGSGSKAEYSVLAGSWQPLVSAFLPTNVNVVSDVRGASSASSSRLCSRSTGAERCR